jgi:hypothetical protein
LQGRNTVCCVVKKAADMNSGQSLFSQLIDHLPQHQFRQCVQRYAGNYRVRSFSCWDQFLSMTFAQLSYRESLRDIVVCLRSQERRLYHLGIRGRISRSTLADANESRDWRIYADFAQGLIQEARRLYLNEDLGLDLANTVYALDSTTIDLCMALFPWAHFSSTQHAVKLHTLLDLRGRIPVFLRITPARIHDVNILDQLTPEAGAFYVMDRGYLNFERLYRWTLQGAFFVTRARKNFRFARLFSHPVDKSSGVQCDQTIALRWFYSAKGYPARLRPHPLLGCPAGKAAGVSHQQLHSFRNGNCRAIPPTLARRTVLQMDQTASAHQGFLWHLGECGEDPGLDCGLQLPTGCHRTQTARPENEPVHNAANSQCLVVRENTDKSSIFAP